MEGGGIKVTPKKFHLEKSCEEKTVSRIRKRHLVRLGKPSQGLVQIIWYLRNIVRGVELHLTPSEVKCQCCLDGATDRGVIGDAPKKGWVGNSGTV